MPEVTTIIDLVSNLGALGFVMWLVWDTTSRTIPRLAKSFEDNLRQAREDYKEMAKVQREDLCRFFAEQMVQERSKMDAVIDAMRRAR